MCTGGRRKKERHTVKEKKAKVGWQMLKLKAKGTYTKRW